MFNSAIESFTRVQSNGPYGLETFSIAGFTVVAKINEIWPEPPFSPLPIPAPSPRVW